MASRKLKEFIADVLRETRGQATVYEARQALQDAVNMIDASANWEFLLATKLINIHASYSTGTVSIASGSFSLTLASGTWPLAVSPFGEYREIRFAERNLPYKIASVTSSTTATLATALSGSATTNIVNGTYVLYQARYPLPTNCEPGRDLALKGVTGIGFNYDGNIPKRERLTYDRHTSETRLSSFTEYYTDDEYDETNHAGTIRIEPYPTTTDEYRLTYYKTLTIPATEEDILMIPVAFERAPILMAASNILRKKNMSGWQTMRTESGDLLKKMYNRYAASPAYEGKINPKVYSDDAEDIFGANNTMYVRE